MATLRVGVERSSAWDLMKAHLTIARFDHWMKNVFVLPGAVVALTAARQVAWDDFLIWLGICLLGTGFVASSNYVINEVMDAPFDRSHPVKRLRPVAAGRVSLPLAYVQWILMMGVGVWLGWMVSRELALSLLGLWVMGVIYNVPPLRTKEIPYLDVLTEAINNPIRMLAGWYVLDVSGPPPASLLVCYWMVGCYFMGAKRLAEYREIGDAARSTAYRRSFHHYDELKLLISLVFYAAFAMLMLGAFIVRYRIEWVLCFPLVSLVMALYLRLAYREHSPVARPEKLYRDSGLMVAVVCCALAMGTLLFVDVPLLDSLFDPSMSGLSERP